jgi:outer membrane protein assembly factor BamB
MRRDNAVKILTRLAALAVITVVGFAPATALSPQRALASAVTPASSSASAPGGTQLWAAIYHGNAQQNQAVAAAASPDGATVYVTGLTGLAHFSTLAYNAATGATRWAATFYGRGYSQPSAMAVSPDGSKVFVTGFTTPPGACCADQFVTVAYNAATGARLWVTRTFSIVHVGSVATAVAVSPNGSTVFVAGDASKNPVLVAYDAATGAQRWVSRYQVPLGAGGTTEGVAVSPDGSVAFLTGSFKAPPAGPKFAVVAYDAATGAQLWAQTAKGSTASRDLAVSPDGSAVIISGTVPRASGGSAFTTTAYAIGSGALRWTHRYPGPFTDNAPAAVTVSPDGQDAFVTGTSTDNVSGVVDFTTVGYATTGGGQLWARSYQPPAGLNVPQGASAAGVSPDGASVYVTGGTSSGSPNTVNFTTIAYRAATGQTAWLARYRGPQNFTFPTALAVGPTGQGLFVTGYTGAHDGCCNFATVAYQP